MMMWHPLNISQVTTMAATPTSTNENHVSPTRTTTVSTLKVISGTCAFFICIGYACYWIYNMAGLSPPIHAISQLHEHHDNHVTEKEYIRQMDEVDAIKQNDVLYIFINGGARKEDFLSNTLLNLEKNQKNYLVFSDDMNYHKDWNDTQKSRYVRVPTKHLKYVLEQQADPDSPHHDSYGKAMLITYMWTQIFEYLIDNSETRKYKAFIISENDIKICNQSLLDEFVFEFLNDSTIDVIHLHDSCRMRRWQPIVRTLGRFHLFKKIACGAVSAMIKPVMLNHVLNCLYKGKQKEYAMDGQQGGFMRCKMSTFYPNELLLVHIGRYGSQPQIMRMDSKPSDGFLYCNQTVYDKNAT
eukprot:1062381_1